MFHVAQNILDNSSLVQKGIAHAWKDKFHDSVQFMHRDPASPLISVGKTIDRVEKFSY